MTSVLLVDDERDLLSLVDFNLRAAGFETMLAATGEQALAALRRRVPDLVVLDVMLPDVSGTEICRMIKTDPRTRHVPVVMLTAKGDEVDRVVGFELGADDYVTKPFSVRELVLRLRALLRRAGAGRPGGAAARGGRAHPHRRRRAPRFVDGAEVQLTAARVQAAHHVHGAARARAVARAAPRGRLGDVVGGRDPHGGHAREAAAREARLGAGPARDGARGGLSPGRAAREGAERARRRRSPRRIRALRAELAGGPRAELRPRGPRARASCSPQRERRAGSRLPREPAEQELLAAIPDAAALVSKEGWVRVSNAAFDTLAASGRAAGLTPLEITRSAELSEAVRRALEGTARRLELQLEARAPTS